MTPGGHARQIARLAAGRLAGEPRRIARRLADPGLAATLGVRDVIEQARDDHLATLDADQGLAALLVPWEDVLAETVAVLARPPTRCARCGARLPRRRRVCSRCHLTAP
jgi:hypothetical protein